MRKLFILAISLAAAAQLVFANPIENRPLVKISIPPVISFTSNDFIDITLSADIYCTGEFVDLEGTLHVLSHITITGNQVIVKSHYQPQGISGTSSSGVKYQATGVTQDVSKGSLVNGVFSYTYINNFRIIGQGPGNNLLIQSVLRFKVTADGEFIVLVEKSSIDCK